MARKKKENNNEGGDPLFENNGTPTVVRKLLRYDFTAPEIHDYSLQLATETRKVSEQEEQKKTATSEYSAKINSAKGNCNRLSTLISNGYEHRDIECTVEYHKPEKGKKTFTRKDNGEKLVEKMDLADYNLFTQESDVTEGELKLLGQ